MTDGNHASDDTQAIRTDIERTRGEMSRTVSAIEERLSPAHLKEQFASVTDGLKADVEHKVADLKESVMGNYHEVKDHLKEDLGRGVDEAKHRVEQELTHARHAVREATVGRMEHMVEGARDSFTDAGSSLMETIRANPIPTALIGVGLGWLLLGGNKRGSSTTRSTRTYRPSRPLVYGGEEGYLGARFDDGDDDGRMLPARGLERGRRAIGDAMHSAQAGVSSLGHRAQEGAQRLVHDAQGAIHGATESVSHLAHAAGNRAGMVAHDAQDAAVHLGSDVRRSGERVYRGAERTLETTMRENPLALGAVALAIGAAIGLSLPHTEIEDEWMGSARERLVERIEGAAGEAIHKAESAVGQLTSGADGGGSESKGSESKSASA